MFTVVIDGPAGAGKGTLVRYLVKLLGERTGAAWRPLDTGSAYRAVGVAAHLLGTPMTDVVDLTYLAAAVQFDPETGVAYAVGETAVGHLIRSPEASEWSSKVAVIPQVRLAVNKRFHAFAAETNIVGDGRDLGSVVFPDALLKVYLTASPRARAERRTAETEGATDIAQIEAAIAERDYRDAHRADAPMTMQADYVLVDTTGRAVQEYGDEVATMAIERMKY